jgi:hypothetical protein
MRMYMASAKRLLLVALVVGGLVLPANAAELKKTTTRGKICGHRCPQHTLYTFGGYVFKGRTWPSEAKQTVRFYYKRVGSDRWKRFGVNDGYQGGRAFKTWPRRNARTKANNQWRTWFTPYRTGRWKIRAWFIPQDGYKASQVTKKIRVLYSE